MLDVEALSSLCSKVETLAPGSVAGFTISDPAYSRIEHAVFPTLPAGFSTALTNVPLQPANFGSCVKAISTGRPIICPDIQHDKLFDPRWREVCLSYGLRSIQSRPIYMSGKPRGTFVLAFREPKPESEWDAALMTFAADAASKTLSA